MLCFFCSFCLLESGVRSSFTCAGEAKSPGQGSQTTDSQAETGRTLRPGRLAQCGAALMGRVLFHWRLHHCGSNLSAASGRLRCYWSFYCHKQHHAENPCASVICTFWLDAAEAAPLSRGVDSAGAPLPWACFPTPPSLPIALPQMMGVQRVGLCRPPGEPFSVKRELEHLLRA